MNTMPTTWEHQDVLRLSIDEWCTALRDTTIFDENALKMIRFVYRMPRHMATASDIADGLSTEEKKIHYNRVTAWN